MTGSAPATPRGLDPVAEEALAAGDPELRSRILDEQVQLTWRHSTWGSIISTLYGAAIAWHFSAVTGPVLAYGWLIMKILVILPRLVMAFSYLRHGFPSGQGWRATTYSMLAIDGVVWGIGCAWLMHADTETAALIGASAAGIAGVATFGLQARVAATAAYIVPIIGMTAISLLLRGDSFGRFGGLGLLFLLALLLITAVLAQQRLHQFFLLTFKSDRLAKEREEALEMASRMSAARSQFLANMSHELRTPLHAIQGMTSLTLNEVSAAETRGKLNHVLDSSKRLLTLIDNLLELARGVSSNAVLAKERFDLRAEIEKIESHYNLQAHEKGLVFSAEIRLPQQMWVIGDANRLRQVLHNLLSNAVKFTSKGWIGLTCKLTAHSDHLCEVFIEVRDTGLGIPAAEMSRIFDAFHAAQQPSRGRIGMGLSVAREIARAMGGDITCHSTVNVGSSFIFKTSLPLAHAGESSQQQIQQGAPLEKEALPRANAPLIVLVEDDEVHTAVARAFLEANGFAVHVPATIDKVPADVMRLRPDLLLLNTRLSGRSGYEIAREIRKLEQQAGQGRIPVLGMSASSAAYDDKLGHDVGMAGIVEKPFTERQIVDAVNALLGVSQAHPKAQQQGLSSDDGQFAPPASAGAFRLVCAAS